MFSAYNNGSGSGSALNSTILRVAAAATIIATLVSATSILMHLKDYRRPILQRMVVRIMLMVPIYAISSLISLFSLEAAFVIDAIRDIYEAFVIYCFFQLLVGYLGGERSLLIRVHGRLPKATPFPMNVFQRELDVSDPFTFLFLKRGILQYVQVKPFLAIASLALKASGKYNEGEFRADSGYLYVSITYNASICLSLYCLAMFWLSINEDLKPFRPMPKFLCVKGILFFSFWQAIGVSLLASVGAIKKLGPYTDKEHISLGLTDTLICLEMPFFAVAHLAAFSHRDYVDKKLTYVGRMPMRHAFRDAFGFKDVFEDIHATLNGRGMDYREFEPSEGHMHQGLGRERRIRAGLRYSQGGRGKYWLPQTTTSSRPDRPPEDSIHAPLLSGDIEDIAHDAGNVADDELVAIGLDLPFRGLDPEDEELFENSRKYLFGDYNYPCIDASSEVARAEMWEEEERILNNERSAWFSDHQGRSPNPGTNYGAVGLSQPQRNKSHSPATAIDSSPTRERYGDRSDAQLCWTNAFKPMFGPKSAPDPGIAHASPLSISTQPGSTRAVMRPDAIDLVTEGPQVTEVDKLQHGSLGSRDETEQPRPRIAEGHTQEKRNRLLAAHVDAEGSEVKTIVGFAAQVEPSSSYTQTRRLENVYGDLEDDENPWL